MRNDPSTPGREVAIPADGEVTAFVVDGRRYVVMPEGDYRGLIATAHLLGSPENAAELAAAVRWAEATFGRDRLIAGPEDERGGSAGI